MTTVNGASNKKLSALDRLTDVLLDAAQEYIESREYGSFITNEMWDHALRSNRVDFVELQQHMLRRGSSHGVWFVSGGNGGRAFAGLFVLSSKALREYLGATGRSDGSSRR